ncbi:MAG: iron-sulfur cluster assembly scaffold protein, partial [Gemmatimonadales bacterium]
ASVMTTAVKGKSVTEAESLFQAFRDMLAGGPVAPGKLAAFGGVRAFPSRIKCANLGWHALHAALQNQAEPVTTETAGDF